MESVGKCGGIKMSKKSCQEKAHFNFITGRVDREFISFRCFRSNELMRKKQMDRSSAWEIAVKESEEIYLK